MRLAPVEHPRNPLVRLAYRLSVWRFGKVMTPLKVWYARKPRLLLLSGHVAHTLENGLSLEPSLRLLVQVQAARLNGCAFCQDLSLAEAVRRRMGEERFRALPDHRTHPVFTGRERAALAFVEEATLHRRVSEETWAALREHFGETEIVELVWANAAENYFNLQAAVLEFESDGLAALAAAKAPPREAAAAGAVRPLEE